MKKTLLLLSVLFAGTAQAQLSGTSYTQNFNSLGSGLPQGWYVDTAATDNQLGTSIYLYNSNGAMEWAHTAGWFKNFASANSLGMGADATTQAQSADRALGLRQTGAVGDPNAAFCFKIDNTLGKTGFSLSFKLQSLDTGSSRTTNWKVDYGVGNNPTSFTNLNTSGNMNTGAHVFSNNTITVTIGNQFDNSNQAIWIRVRPAGPSTGSGTRASTAIDDFHLSWTNTSGGGTDYDTVTVMNYNLLYYGASDNLPNYKNPRLATIVQNQDPDILGVNEVLNNSSYSQSILDNALGSAWTKGNYSNSSNSLYTNMLFWKTAKFGLKSQTVISVVERDIIAYKLFYKDGLTIPHDTVYLTVIVAHLKAGGTSSDSLTRISETQNVANYLNANGPGNFIFMGDMNVYTSNEQCYQNLVSNTNTNGKLYDPINSPGNWNSNFSFAAIHTQSTRTAALSDGGSTGGLDDRFDQQLVSGPVMQGSDGVEYIAQSYKAVGQDGQHYNSALTDLPVNTSVPGNVLTALYELSDHLPVQADYRIQIPTSVRTINKPEYNIIVSNPINDALRIKMDNKLRGKSLNVTLLSTDGKVAYENRFTATGDINLQLPDLADGMYILHITEGNESIFSSKLVKN